MTVPGKGGRPRKWRSDADRVRAFRARQRGDEEPASLDVALHDGDALAVALARIDDLQASAVEGRRRDATVATELAAAQRRSDGASRRADRAAAQIAELHEQLTRLQTDLTIAHDQLQSLRAENGELRRQLEQGRSFAPVRPLNRAERRRVAKRDRRRE